MDNTSYYITEYKNGKPRVCRFATLGEEYMYQHVLHGKIFDTEIKAWEEILKCSQNQIKQLPKTKKQLQIKIKTAHEKLLKIDGKKYGRKLLQDAGILKIGRAHV